MPYHTQTRKPNTLISARAHCRMHSGPSPMCRCDAWRRQPPFVCRRRCVNVRDDVCLSVDWCSVSSCTLYTRTCVYVSVRMCIRRGCSFVLGIPDSMVMAEQIVVLILLLLQNRLCICSDLFAILTQYDRLISRLWPCHTFSSFV